MAGNCWELVNSAYQSYPDMPIYNPIGCGGNSDGHDGSYIQRGGGCGSTISECRVSYRHPETAFVYSYDCGWDYGLRLVIRP